MMFLMSKSPITSPNTESPTIGTPAIGIPAIGTPAVRFAAVAARIAEASRSEGLRAPGFKTPPRRPGFDRTIRRVGRDTVVSVTVKGRPFAAVIADLIEGVVTANRLTGVEAGRIRGRLWDAVAGHTSPSVVAA